MQTKIGEDIWQQPKENHKKRFFLYFLMKGMLSYWWICQYADISDFKKSEINLNSFCNAPKDFAYSKFLNLIY